MKQKEIIEPNIDGCFHLFPQSRKDRLKDFAK